MWTWGIQCYVTKHTRKDPPWLWNLGEMSTEVQNRDISRPTKRLIWSKKRLGCNAGHQQVSRYNTRCEPEEFNAMWQSIQGRDPPWLWNLGETSTEVQDRGISRPTKRLIWSKNKKDFLWHFLVFIPEQRILFLTWDQHQTMKKRCP